MYKLNSLALSALLSAVLGLNACVGYSAPGDPPIPIDPTAQLLVSVTGTGPWVVHLDASRSFLGRNSAAVSYQWDTNGDGTFGDPPEAGSPAAAADPLSPARDFTVDEPAEGTAAVLIVLNSGGTLEASAHWTAGPQPAWQTVTLGHGKFYDTVQLALIGGHPALYAGSIDGLKYARADSATGAAAADWHSVSLDRDDLPGTAITFGQGLAEVDGQVAFLCYRGGLWLAHAPLAQDTNPAAWQSSFLNFQTHFNSASLAVADGTPVLAAAGDGLLFARATAGLGTDWQVTPLSVQSGTTHYADVGLTTVDGCPALACVASNGVFGSSSGAYQLCYGRSATASGAAGADWTFQSLLRLDYSQTPNIDMHSSGLQLIAGLPALAVSTAAGKYDINHWTSDTVFLTRYAHATTSAGSGAWTLDTVDDQLHQSSPTSLASIGGAPAVGYAGRLSELRTLPGANAPGWQTEQFLHGSGLAGLEVDGHPAVAYFSSTSQTGVLDLKYAIYMR